jgi:3-hydroxypropanoate dehydrogenase
MPSLFPAIVHSGERAKPRGSRTNFETRWGWRGSTLQEEDTMPLSTEATSASHVPVSEEALDRIFREARSFSYWLPTPVNDDTLRTIYELMKWGPTSANSSPARFLFLRTPEAKQRLVPALAPANVSKAMTAPVTVIVGYELRFYEALPKLFPHAPGYRDVFANSPELAEVTARRNSSLQGAYLMIAARALGLDCGPMSGFDNAKVDQEFFGAGKEVSDYEQEFFPQTHVRSNFLCNLGYGDRFRLHPRNPRLEFEEACSLL